MDSLSGGFASKLSGVHQTGSSPEYEFYLYPVTEEIEAELTQIGDRNVHSLSKKYFDTLKDYYRHYQQQLTPM